MRIAILTRRAGFNMGSSLQAYAMAKMLGNLGHKVEILNYDEYSHNILWRIKPYFQEMAYHLLKPWPLRCIFASAHRKLTIDIEQQKKFKQFEQQYLPLSQNLYRNGKQIASAIGKYDAFVCGSDQIWSPDYFDPVFLLDFIPQGKGVRKIAYAPSIGAAKKEAISKRQCKMMSAIDYVSCREKEGTDVLSDILNRHIVTTLDPTLMIDKQDWDKLKSNKSLPFGGKYILCYFLHTKYYKNNIPNHFIQRLKNLTSLPIVNIQMHNLPQIVEADLHLRTCAPTDFVSLVSSASYVVTNSFHCCVFSHIYNRRFFVFERFRMVSDVNKNENPRIYTLLNLIGKRDALISDQNAKIDIRSRQENTDQLEKQRNISFDFLKSALSQ